MEHCADIWRCFHCTQEWLVIRSGLVTWELVALAERVVTPESYLLTGPSPTVCPRCGGLALPDALIYYPDQAPYETGRPSTGADWELS